MPNTEDINSLTPPSPSTPLSDPILSALESRARDLSFSISNPATIATKLRESLVSLVGENATVAYHIGASFDSSTNRVQFEISKLSPHFVAQLLSDTKSASLSVAYTNKLGGGDWTMAIGLEASTSDIRSGTELTTKFSMTIKR